MSSDAETQFACVAYNTRKPPIDAAMLRLRKVSQQGQPARLSIYQAEQKLDFWCLRDFCQDLAKRSSRWESFCLSPGVVKDLTVFEITGQELIQEGQANEAEQQGNEMQQALAALAMLNPKMKPEAKRKPHGKAKASAGGAKKASQSAKSKAKKLALEEMLEMSDSSGSAVEGFVSADEDSDNETGSAKPAAPADSQAAVVAPPPPAPVAGRAPPRVGRTTKKRSQAWGTFPAFQLGPIMSQGMQVGFGAVCSRHHNPGSSRRLCLIWWCALLKFLI